LSFVFLDISIVQNHFIQFGGQIMTLIRYQQPWSLLSELQNLLTLSGNNEETSLLKADFLLPVDIKETENQIEIMAELPGVNPEEVQVTMENGNLCIKGQKVTESKEQKENFSRIERFSGSFQRQFRLPENIDSENITANMDKGVLHLIVPKMNRRQDKAIKIETKK